jgi:hypothetical protein
MIEVVGKNGIIARVIKDSISLDGHRFTTFEIEYPRMILSEANTHRALSKNSSSSRAVPYKRAIELIKNSPAVPVHWGMNKEGMSAAEELSIEDKEKALKIWLETRDLVIEQCDKLADIKLHKQVINRLSEPFSMMKTVISGTEFENLWWLRDHADAQPEFQELAKVMHEAYNISTPTELVNGEWHLPYVDSYYDDVVGEVVYRDQNGQEMELEVARKVSASCCAQVSYRRLDDSLEKAIKIYDNLVSASRVHASPFEHEATPIVGGDEHPIAFLPQSWPEGVTHVRRDGTLCSGNLQGWIQFRQLIPNNTKW